LYEIKKLVNEIKNEETETIHVTIVKIKNIIDKIVDKKMSNDTKKHIKKSRDILKQNLRLNLS
jgi:ribosomal protein S20